MHESAKISEEIPGDAKIVILAGRGQYPVICAKNIKRYGFDFTVIAVDDEVDKAWLQSLPRDKVYFVPSGHLGKLLKILKKISATHIIMAGQVKPKKLFHGMFPDWKALSVLAKLKERNAETIFGAIVHEIESIGANVIDARSFMWDQLAESGHIVDCGGILGQDDIDFGIKIAREIARLNIGQSVVIRKGTVVAVEDFAGTDEMIRRVGNFGISGAVFVKVAKHNQDFRFDVPVFGVTTVENLSNSNINFAVLESQKTLLLDKSNVISIAKELGISIIGF